MWTEMNFAKLTYLKTKEIIFVNFLYGTYNNIDLITDAI